MMGGLAVVLLMFGGLGVWAARTQIAGAVVANGTVVVETSVKKVQHPTGGVVGAILVKEGDKVMAGDPLIRLDDTVTRANLQIINRQLDELMMRGARLGLELDLGPEFAENKEFTFPTTLLQRADDPYVQSLFATEKIAYSARRETCSSQKSQFDERVAQLKEEAAGLTSQIEANAKEVDYIGEELKGLEQLETKQLVTTTKMVERKREAARLAGQQSQLRASAAQAKGKIAETELQKLSHFQQLRADIVKEQREVQAKEVELKERQVTAEDQLRRTDLRSPQTGVVHELNVHTVGGVIEPGEQIMLIVPEGDKLVIEARIDPRDIDQVRASKSANVRFPAFNTRTTPEFKGTVSRVSADLNHDQQKGLSYYVARVVLNDADVQDMVRDGLTLSPGMPAEVLIQTSERTALSYLLKPLEDAMAHAFKER
jgi:HlyD family secretion protein